jgi:ribosomal protein S18 acetylase RimI-like enzyme
MRRRLPPLPRPAPRRRLAARNREGAAPIGYALLARPDLPGVPPDGDDLELKRIYVFSRFHGSGAAAALLEPVLARAEAGGAARLLLGVYAGNGRAIAFYRKSGFEPVGRRRFTVGDRAYDDVVLARPLTAAAPRQQPEPAWT